MDQVVVSEFDQAGELLAIYTTRPKEGSTSVQKAKSTKPAWERLVDVFLPAGYPSSVTDDYISYQIYAWDSLQAFSSSIAGMLASRAVLEGVGVGDATSHPTTALLLSVFQESFGRIATILFAHRLGSALEPECKRYRLAADVFNDLAMILDCLSPALPKPTRVAVFSGSSALRALCGVAAGSAKASLSAHFARRGNLGDVNAKDSSQETVISLLGMLAGSAVVAWISSPTATWATLLILLALHLALNYLAVRSVTMHSLNRQRANLVFSHLLAHDKVLTPRQAAALERTFERDGVLRWLGGEVLGRASIGVGMEELLSSGGGDDLYALSRIFGGEEYLLRADAAGSEVRIALKQGCSPAGQLKAWLHALIMARDGSLGGEGDAVTVAASSLKRTRDVWSEFSTRLASAGWALDEAALETGCGPRISSK